MQDTDVKSTALNAYVATTRRPWMAREPPAVENKKIIQAGIIVLGV